jgi:hypothetical protein
LQYQITVHPATVVAGSVAAADAWEWEWDNRARVGAGMSFPVADPPWQADMDSHDAKTGKYVALERFIGQIFNCHFKRGN